MIRLEIESILSAQMRLREQRRIVLEEPDWFSDREKTTIFNQSMISVETKRANAPIKLERKLIVAERWRFPWFPKNFWLEGDLSYKAPFHG